MGLQPNRIKGYSQEVTTHSAVADAVFDGSADTGLAVFAAAKSKRLDFIPLFEERFDFVFPAGDLQTDLLFPILDHIHSARFQNEFTRLGGYDSHDTGKETLVS